MKEKETHRLGDYIREVDVRNEDLSVTKLYGVNLSKEFMPSVANTIGTDMSKYKIVSYNQFGCKLMSVERDRKMPVSLMKDKEPAILSSAYYVFEVVDESILLPDFLFLQIKSSEFDRRLWFGTGGDVRGGATWEGLCEMPIIVPTLVEQQRIVNQYFAIKNRISINKQTIENLECAAMAIYRKMFIDGIDRTNLPQGWKLATLDEIASISAGGDRPELVSDKYSSETPIPIYSNGIENDGLYGFTDKAKINDPCVTVSARGTIGFVCFRPKPFVPIVRLLVFSPINEIKGAPLFLTYLLKHTRLEGDGAVQLQLTAPEAAKTTIQLPPTTDIIEFEKKCRALQTYKTILEQENKQYELFSLV